MTASNDDARHQSSVAHLPEIGFLRLPSILSRPRGPIPVSKSTWWAGVVRARYPSR